MNCLLKVFELSTDLIAISSLYGTIEVVNPAFEKALGHRMDDLKGRDITSLFHEEDAIFAQQVLQRMGAQHPPMELRIRDNQGQFRWVNLQTHLSTEDRKRIFIAQAISAKNRNKVKQEDSLSLNQHREELNQLNHLLSHDIKEPVRNIVSFSNLALREVPSNSKLEEYFQFIIQSGKQLQLLINNLLMYNNIDQQDQVTFRHFEMQALIDRLRSNLSEVMAEKGGQLIYNEMPRVYGNEHLIFMVFKHLFENGFLYNNSAEPRVEVHYDSTPRFHQFLVTDNGIGIESEFHHYVFDLFKRLHNRQEYLGAGIGLATTKKILEKMDGEIRILHSSLGKGSAFLVRFPIVKPREKQSSRNLMSEPPAIAATE